MVVLPSVYLTERRFGGTRENRDQHSETRSQEARSYADPDLPGTFRIREVEAPMLEVVRGLLV